MKKQFLMPLLQGKKIHGGSRGGKITFSSFPPPPPRSLLVDPIKGQDFHGLANMNKSWSWTFSQISRFVQECLEECIAALRYFVITYPTVHLVVRGGSGGRAKCAPSQTASQGAVIIPLLIPSFMLVDW